MEKENDIDSLARMVAQGFAEMGERFDGLEKTVNETNKRIDTVVVPTLDAHSHRIKKLEEQIA